MRSINWLKSRQQLRALIMIWALERCIQGPLSAISLLSPLSLTFITEYLKADFKWLMSVLLSSP
jgi:hypothetical protein